MITTENPYQKEKVELMQAIIKFNDSRDNAKLHELKKQLNDIEIKFRAHTQKVISELHIEYDKIVENVVTISKIESLYKQYIEFKYLHRETKKFAKNVGELKIAALREWQQDMKKKHEK